MTQPSPSHDELDAWVSETAQRALGYAMTLIRDRDDAEDIVHDCYSRLLEKADEYDLPRAGTKLLFKSITNACINWMQRRPPQRSLEEIEAVGGRDRQALADRQATDPAQGVIRGELEQAVQKAMSELPVVQRAAVELRSLGHSLVEVAQMLQVSHANARVLLHRARSTLALKLRPYIEEKV